MRIIWSKDAAVELIQIIKYLKENVSNQRAENVYKNIKNLINISKTAPEGGRFVPELVEIGIYDIHELIENPWRIFYKISNQEIRILTVIDGRRNLEDILYKKIMEGKLK